MGRICFACSRSPGNLQSPKRCCLCRCPQKLLPAEIEVPTSFDCVGHIAHLNLREEQQPYKDIIGQVRVARP